MFYWIMKRVIVGPLLNLLFRPWIKGVDNIPASGPAVLVSNHLSFSDSIFLPIAVPRPVVFLAKSEYFTGRGLKGRMTAMFFRLSNQLPMDRSGGAASSSSLTAGMDILNDGGLLGIYPEGTRSPDGRLYRGKTGVAKLVLATGVPVIPVAMIGTDKVQPIGRRIPNIRRVGVIIGEPLDFSRYEGLADDRFVQRSVTDEIMYELMRLSGQEYVDAYASTVKDKLAAEKAAGKKTIRPGADNRRAAVRISPAEQAATPAPGAVTEIGTDPVGTDSIGKSTVGNSTVGKEAVGEKAVGKSTVGKRTVEKNTVGRKTVGGKTVGRRITGNSAVGTNPPERKIGKPQPEDTPVVPGERDESSGRTGM